MLLDEHVIHKSQSILYDIHKQALNCEEYLVLIRGQFPSVPFFSALIHISMALILFYTDSTWLKIN